MAPAPPGSAGALPLRTTENPQANRAVPQLGAALQGGRVDPGRNPSAGWLRGASTGTLNLSIAVVGTAQETLVFNLVSFPRSCRQGIRSIVGLSLCAAMPMPPSASPQRVTASRPTDSGPGWYESSWELGCGLEIAEVPDLDAELTWCIKDWLSQGNATELA